MRQLAFLTLFLLACEGVPFHSTVGDGASNEARTLDGAEEIAGDEGATAEASTEAGASNDASNEEGGMDAAMDVTDAAAEAEAEAEAGCSLTTHSNGAGQTWGDCLALGTYSVSEAMRACLAWTDANPTFSFACASSDATKVAACGVQFVYTAAPATGGNTLDYVWIYDAVPGASANPGDLFNYVTPLPGTCVWPKAAGSYARWE